MTPLFNVIPEIPHPFDLVLILALLIFLAVGIFFKNRKLFLLIFGVLIILLLQDQMRWQPWVYLYILILLPFLKSDSNKISRELFNYFQIILIGIYLWSGIHKLNPNFVEIIFNDILKNFLHIENSETINNLSTVGYFIPITEILIGLSLSLPKFRNIGVYFALVTHVFILTYLSPLGIDYNSIVYPWNMAMIIIVFLVFFKTNNRLVLIRKSNLKLQIINLLPIILIWILPILSFFGKWDNYLSFSLYSGKINNFYIAIEESQLKKISTRYAPYFVEIDGMAGGEVIDVNMWSMGELNVPFYPETRVFKKLRKTFCSLGIADDRLVFIEFENPLERKKFYSFDCKD